MLALNEITLPLSAVFSDTLHLLYEIEAKEYTLYDITDIANTFF